jgi:hypothetical protein
MIWIKRIFLTSLLIFVVGTLVIIFALPFLTAGMSSTGAAEGAMAIMLFYPFGFVALVLAPVVFVWWVWKNVRKRS